MFSKSKSLSPAFRGYFCRRKFRPQIFHFFRCQCKHIILGKFVRVVLDRFIHSLCFHTIQFCHISITYYFLLSDTYYFISYFQFYSIINTSSFNFLYFCHSYDFLQSSGALSVWSKRIRLFDKSGVPGSCRPYFIGEICFIFMKNQTKCSTFVLQNLGRTAAEIYGIRQLKAGSAAQP